MLPKETMAAEWKREHAVNGYDEPAEKPLSLHDDLRSIYLSLNEQQKMDAELMERLQQLVNRVDRLERVIGE